MCARGSLNFFIRSQMHGVMMVMVNRAAAPPFPKPKSTIVSTAAGDRREETAAGVECVFFLCVSGASLLPPPPYFLVAPFDRLTTSKIRSLSSHCHLTGGGTNNTHNGQAERDGA